MHHQRKSQYPHNAQRGAGAFMAGNADKIEKEIVGEIAGRCQEGYAGDDLREREIHREINKP